MIVFFPCYSIESLSLERASGEPNELMSGFSALFHPALLERFGKVPRWENASSPLSDLDCDIAVVPPFCESMIGERWFEEMKDKPTVIVRGISNRDEIVARLLEATGLENHGFSADFVADSLAIGTAYLMTELMTRQLRYMSILDNAILLDRIKETIAAFRAGDTQEVSLAFQGVFELFRQSKEYCFPTSAHLIDLVLLAESTLGEPLQDILKSEICTNLHLSADLLEKIHDREPFTFAALKHAFLEGKLDIIGNDPGERPLYMLPVTEIVDRILAGTNVYKKYFGKSPAIYGRGNVGLTPIIPQLLKLSGYEYVIPFAPRDGWEIEKETKQSKLFWKGPDGTKLGALARYPFNATDSDVYFKIPDRFSQTMNYDSSPSIVFARYPGQAVQWLEDFRRMDAYSPVIGHFAKLGDYFEETRYTGTVKEFSFADFKTNALSRAVRDGRDDPISNWRRFYSLISRRTVYSALRLMIAGFAEKLPDTIKNPDPADPASNSGAVMYEILSRKLFDPVESKPENTAESEDEAENILENGDIERLEHATADYDGLGERLAGDLAAVLCGGTSTHSGLLIVNPLPFARTAVLDVSEFSQLPDISEGILSARSLGNRKEIALELLPLGYRWVGPGSGGNEPAKPQASESGGFFAKLFGFNREKKEPALIEKREEISQKRQQKTIWLLRNDFFEARVEAKTGVLQSVHTYENRNNRFSQQPAMRMSQGDRAADPREKNDRNRGFTILAADSIEQESLGPLSASLKIRGRMMKPDGTVAAEYTQRYIVRRYSRVIETELEIVPKELPSGKPWDTFYCFRNIWGDPSLEMTGGIHDACFPLETELIQSPQFVDLREDEQAVTLLCDGLAFHRSIDERELLTILTCKGETGRKFRFGVGFDLQNPTRAALEFREPFLKVPSERPGEISGQLLKVGSKHVNIVRYEPLFAGNAGSIESLSGVRLWLLETHGLKTECSLISHRPMESVRKTDFRKEELERFPSEDGRKITIPIRKHELAVIEIRFKMPESEV